MKWVGGDGRGESGQKLLCFCAVKIPEAISFLTVMGSTAKLLMIACLVYLRNTQRSLDGG